MQSIEQIALPVLAVIGVVLATQVPFFLLSLVIALRERHRGAVYVPVDESEALPTNAYMDLNNAAAGALGFEYLGACRAGNTRIYKVRYDTWVSSDRRVFAVVGAGRVSVIPHQAVWLTSKLTDGRVLITVDQPGAMGGDLSGMTEWKVVQNADFAELLAGHLARVDAEVTPVEPYGEADPLGEHIDLIAGRAERMARAGYVHYLDDDRDEWRYTAWGALVRVCDSYRKIFVQIVRNYGRRKMSRPGDYGYVPSQRVKTRSGLRYVEVGLCVAIFVGVLFMGSRPANPRQAAFRALVPLVAFLGLATIWVWRWRISRTTVDPATRRRRRFVLAGVVVLAFGLSVLARSRRETVDDVYGCKVLVGGGRVYVVVEGGRMVVRTSPLTRFLARNRAGGGRRLVSWTSSVHILESDGRTALDTLLPAEQEAGEMLPVGDSLYMIDASDEHDDHPVVWRWRDGRRVAVPAEERDRVRKVLDDDAGDPWAAQGWEYTLLAGNQAPRFSRVVPLGDRKVTVDVSLVPSKADKTRVLHARIEAPGAEPLVRTFPAEGKGRP